MTRKALSKALQKHNARKAREAASERVERIVVQGYPADHNPYLQHLPTATCYRGCKH